MYEKNKFKKTISVVVLILFAINNISQAAPDFGRGLQKKSALRELSSVIDGQTPQAIGNELKAKPMPVNMVKKLDAKKGLWQASRGKGEVIATAELEISDGGNADLTQESERELRGAGQEARETAGIFTAGLNRLLEITKRLGISLPEEFLSTERPTLLEFGLLKDNDTLFDLVPVSLDLEGTGKFYMAIDTDAAKVDKKLREGLELLIALSLYYTAQIISGMDERAGLHAVLDLYIRLGKPDKPKKTGEITLSKEKEAIRKALRSNAIDSGNAFWFFLEKALDNPFYAREDQQIDITEVSKTTTGELHLQVRKAEEEIAGARGRSRKKERDELEKVWDRLWKQIEWRDQCISELMRYSHVDLPYDAEGVDKLLSRLYDDLMSGKPVNVDEREAEVLALITETYDSEVEGENMWRTAKESNQAGRYLVTGRLSRAFGNQARLYSVAAYLIARKALIPEVQALRDIITDEGIEELYNPVERLLVILKRAGDVSMVEARSAIEDFIKAVDKVAAEKNVELTDRFASVTERRRTTPVTMPAYKERARTIRELFGDIKNMGMALWNELEESPKRAATFVVFLQRLTLSTEGMLLGRTNSMRDPHPGQEPDLRDLKRRGGENIYASRGDGTRNGKGINWIMFSDDWWEAIPLFIKERLINIAMPDGSVKRITQTEVDQRGMEAFYRSNAQYWAENLQIAEYSWFASMARDVLLGKGKYKKLKDQITRERGERLTHARLMEAIEKKDAQFKDDLTALAVIIALSAHNLSSEITRYRNSHKRSSRKEAIEAIVIKSRRPSKNNLYKYARREARRSINKLPDICREIITAQLTAKDAEGALLALRAGLISDEIKDYWDWLPRNSPLQEVLTTESAGMTEGYVKTWNEQEMERYNIIKWMGLADEVKKKRDSYTAQIFEIAELVIDRLKLQDEVTIAENELDMSHNDAVFAVLRSNITVGRATAQLSLLIDNAIENGKDKRILLREIEAGLRAVKEFSEDSNLGLTEENIKGLIQKAISDVIFINGPAVQEAVDKAGNIEEAVKAVTSKKDWAMDYEGQLYMRIIEYLISAENTSENQLSALAATYIWDHTALGLSTARREVIEESGLGYLVTDYGFTHSGNMTNLLVYSPSRVNLGHGEKDSVDTWAQTSGPTSIESARAVARSHRMINKHPRIWSSAVSAEVFKTFENATAVVNTALGNVLGLIINAVGRGDAEVAGIDMTERDDRKIWSPSEAYGGYCVPKDGLFLAYVLTLDKKYILRQIGVPANKEELVRRAAKKVLLKRAAFMSENDWEAWAAEELKKAHQGLGELADVVEKEDGGKILSYNILRIARVLGSALGMPDIETADPEKIMLNALARHGAEKLIVSLEQLNRLMPFVKAHMILRQLQDNGAESVNITAEYKAVPDGGAVKDIRFSGGLRIYEILAGICDHLIRQLDPHGQMLAILLRYGFDLDSEDKMVREAAVRYMREDRGLWLNAGERKDKSQAEQIILAKERYSSQIEKLQLTWPAFKDPKNLRLTCSTGVGLTSILNYTDDRLIGMEAVADEAQRVIQDITGLSEEAIAANATSYGDDISKWDGLRDGILEKAHGNRIETEKRYNQLLNTKIKVRGGGEEFEYSLRSAVHYLSMKQRLPGRSYEEDIQGCAVINLGVVPDKLKDIILNQPKLITLMLAGNPNADPALTDGPAGQAGGGARAYTPRDMMDFFAACEAYGKAGRYWALGFGDGDIKPLREKMHYQRERAQVLMEAILKVAGAEGREATDRAAQEALSIYHELVYEATYNQEAERELQDEKDLKHPSPRQRQQHRLIAEVLVRLNSGLPLGELDFGSWLAIGGMYEVIGKPEDDIEEMRESFNKAIAIIARSEDGKARIRPFEDKAFSKDKIDEMIKVLAKPAYVPEARKFGQEQMVELSAKSVEISVSEARARRRALRIRAIKAVTDKRVRDGYKAGAADIEKIEGKDAGPARLNRVYEAADVLRHDIIIRANRLLNSSDPNEAACIDKSHNVFALYGALAAWTGVYLKELAHSLIRPEAEERDELLSNILEDIDEVFTSKGFNAEEVKRLLGGYEYPTAVLQVLAEYARGRDREGKKQKVDWKKLGYESQAPIKGSPEDKLQQVLEAVRLVYTCFALAQTLEFAQFQRGDVEQAELWDKLTVFFAETIDDHYYWYKPWALSRGTAFEDMPAQAIYSCSYFIHQGFYEYIREFIIKRSDLADMQQQERELLIGNFTEGHRLEAIGAYIGRADVPYPELIWRAYGQLRETVFVMNDGLQEMALLKLDPDTDFHENTAYPIPIVFDEFDPDIIEASERINLALLYPTGRTHLRGFLREGPALNRQRTEAGKRGANVIIVREADIEKVEGAKYPVVKVRSGHIFLSEEEFIKARRMQGFSREAAQVEVEILKKQGRFIDRRIRCAIKVKKGREIFAGSVAPFHHMPKFNTGTLEAVKIPATCQSLFTWFVTYRKSLYAEVIKGTAIKLPPEIRWLKVQTRARAGNKKALEQAVIDGSDDFRGLTNFAEEFPIIIIKGAEESGARNLKVLNMMDEKGRVSRQALKEAAKFIVDISQRQDVVIQKAIWISPEYWADERLMAEMVRRRITERTQAIHRERYPQTAFYCSLRTVPASASPDKEHDIVDFIAAINTEVATNVGRGGSLFALLPEYMRQEVRDKIFPRLMARSREVMAAIKKSADNPKIKGQFKQFLKEIGATEVDDVGEDIFGDSYAWPPTLLLDWFIEPVFGRDGHKVEDAELVEIRPVYDKNARRTGSEFILRGPDGKLFKGEILDWEVYLVEPNTGIGQLDRRYLEMWKLEARRAANAGDEDERHIDWNRIEGEDLVILNSWIDRGQRYMEKNFDGGNAFTPAPELKFPKPSITPAQVRQSYGLAEEEVKAGKTTGNLHLDRALDAAREALELGTEAKFDGMAFSVLLKYYLIEKLKEKYDLDEVRGKIMQKGREWEGYPDFNIRVNHYVNNVSGIKEAMSLIIGKQLEINGDKLAKMLTGDGYRSAVGRLVLAYFITEGAHPEVEILPDKLMPSMLSNLMGGKKYLIGHISANNPIAPNETYALMISSKASLEGDIAVVGIDRANLTNDNTAANRILALLKSPEDKKERLVEAALTEPLPLNAIWRDETSPSIKTVLPQVNPREVSELAYDKVKTLNRLLSAGVNVPLFLGVDLSGPAEAQADTKETISKILKQWLSTPSKDEIEIFVSPDRGTQGIMTKNFTITKRNLDEVIDRVLVHISSIKQKLGDTAIIREGVGNARYAGEGDNRYTLDFRYNVVYLGNDEYGVASEYATVARDPEAATSSVREGGRFISTLDAYNNITATLPDGSKARVSLNNQEIKNIHQEACQALAVLNNDRAEDERLLFAGVDAKLSLEFIQDRAFSLTGERMKVASVVPVILEINSQPAGLSHSYRSSSVDIDDAIAAPEVAGGLWDYLEGVFKEGTKSSSAGSTPDGERAHKNSLAEKMNKTLEGFEEAGRGSEVLYLYDEDLGWKTDDIESQKLFFKMLQGHLRNKDAGEFCNRMIKEYISWLMIRVFSEMQKMKTEQPYANRLYPNKLMQYISAELNKDPHLKVLFSKAANKELPGFLATIVDENTDIYHRFLTDLVTDRNTFEKAVEKMADYAGQHRELESAADIVKAEPAYAIAADILRGYLDDEERARELEARIKEVDRLLYAKYKEQVLTGIPSSSPHFPEGAENRAFSGFSPNRVCLSSAVGSDARYAVYLDPDGGWAVSAPVLFTEFAGEPETMPYAIARRRSEPEIVIRDLVDISSGHPTEITITPDNVKESLFSPRDGKAFGDIKDIIDKEGKVIHRADPLHFIKYALFFTGIIGSGIDSVPDSIISAQEKEEARNDSLLLAQLYYDKCPEQALKDIENFTRGGGIELTSGNPLAPMSAGFSSSSSASIRLLMALYKISGQNHFTEDAKLCSDMALIFENDLGRGTGPQDTAGMLAGFKNMHYRVVDGEIVEDIKELEIAPDILESIAELFLVFTPNLPRAASESIGERQIAYLLREPERLKAIMTAKRQHHQIVDALVKGRFDELGRLMLDYTLNRQKIHDVLPDEMRRLFEKLTNINTQSGERLAKGLIPLSHGGELAGAMGQGAAATIIATEYGIEKVADPQSPGESISLLELEIRNISSSTPYFEGAYLRRMHISPKGPYAEAKPSSAGEFIAGELILSTVDFDNTALVELGLSETSILNINAGLESLRREAALIGNIALTEGLVKDETLASAGVSVAAYLPIIAANVNAGVAIIDVDELEKPDLALLIEAKGRNDIKPSIVRPTRSNFEQLKNMPLVMGSPEQAIRASLAKIDFSRVSSQPGQAPSRQANMPPFTDTWNVGAEGAFETDDSLGGKSSSAGVTFAEDLEFLKKHFPDTRVLVNSTGTAQIAIVPELQGRVMTTTADGPAGLSFGWLNRKVITDMASGRFAEHINVPGGEERFWIGPEGGQFSIFFGERSSDKFLFEEWQTPAIIDTEEFPVAGGPGGHTSVAFRKRGHLANRFGTLFDVQIDREIRLLSKEKARANLGIGRIPGAVKTVAYQSSNRLTNIGYDAWTKERGLLSIWILGMYNPSPDTTVVIPFKAGPEEELGPIVNDAYFGRVPDERLVIDNKRGLLFFSGDGAHRSKIGISPRRAMPVLGSYDAKNEVLTIVQYDKPEGALDYVNSMWQLQDEPYRGDAVNSYNDGPPEPGAKPLGPFYELETSSPAAELKPEESISHTHRTMHLQGPREELDKIALATLGVGLDEIEASLSSKSSSAGTDDEDRQDSAAAEMPYYTDSRRPGLEARLGVDKADERRPVDEPLGKSSSAGRATLELNRELRAIENILLGKLIAQTAQAPGKVRLLNEGLLTESLQRLTELSIERARSVSGMALSIDKAELIDAKIEAQEIVIKTAEICAPAAIAESDGTIIVDPSAIPDERQRQAVISMLKDERLRSALEYALSAKDKGAKVTAKTRIVLITDVNRATLNREKSILISDSQKLDGVKLFKVGVKEDNMLLPMAPIIAIARGLLSLDSENFRYLYPTIKSLYQKFTKGGIIEPGLKTALENGTWSVFELIITNLPSAEKLKREDIERLQRQSLAALIAA